MVKKQLIQDKINSIESNINLIIDTPIDDYPVYGYYMDDMLIENLILIDELKILLDSDEL